MCFFVSSKEYMTIKTENEKLNQLLNSSQICQEHEMTIVRLQQTLLKLNEQYETIKSQYQRLISIQQHTPSK